MDKEFNFSSVGKKMPYSVSDDFFVSVTSRTIVTLTQKKRYRVLRRAIGIAVSIIILCGVSFAYFGTENLSVDEVITRMSDSDLEVLVSLSDSDVLFNDELL